jgi:hypothetical protein
MTLFENNVMRKIFRYKRGDVTGSSGNNAEVKERIALHLYSLSGPSWFVLGRNMPFSLLLVYVKHPHNVLP